MSENQDIILLYKRLSSSQARLALATLISAKGSSYRRPGSRALIVDNGTSVGGLSAGCLEKDIACRLDSSTTEPFCLDYDLTAEQEDDPRGFPFGCGGQVIVLVEPLNDPCIASDTMSALAWCDNLTEAGILCTVTSSGHHIIKPGNRARISDGNVEWFLPQDQVKDHALLGAEILRHVNAQINPRTALVPFQIGSAVVQVLIEHIKPTIELTIYGDGQDAMALEQIAILSGARVERLGKSAIRTGLTNMPTSPYQVVMSHDLHLDRAIVERLTQQKLKYLGILGPRSRTQKILEHVDQLSTSLSIYAPIGIDIAAETPGEIALSIMAEILAVSRNRQARHLRDSTGPIHHGSQTLLSAILAAGASSRLGQAKQLIEHQGKTLLQGTISAVKNGTHGDRQDIVVVTGALHEPLAAIVDDCDAGLVFNSDWRDGLSSSIYTAVRWAMSQNATHLLLSICDQPHLSASHIEALRNASLQNQDCIIASTYADTLGIPAIFPASYFAALLSLKGDEGAKKIIKNAAQKDGGVVMVAFAGGEIDIDTPECAARLAQSKL